MLVIPGPTYPSTSSVSFLGAFLSDERAIRAPDLIISRATRVLSLPFSFLQYRQEAEYLQKVGVHNSFYPFFPTDNQ